MHESGVIRRLLDEAAQRVGGPIEQLEMLRFEIGAIAPVTVAGLRHGVTDAALQRWGFSPRIEIAEGEDPGDPAAQSVKLVAITVVP